MENISSVDSNFVVNTKLNVEGVKFCNVRQHPFEICGVFYENGKFRRLPEAVAKTVNDGVYALHTHTAGGRLRFRTDSQFIAIHSVMSDIVKMPHCALTGSAGFDMYVGAESQKYITTFIPPYDIVDGYESIFWFDSAEMRDITINFPLYSSVNELYIGVSEQANVCTPTPYRYKKPIVYYGSSITQGGCASRPGMSYESIISRRLNADYINLGFSGNARAEDEIAEYISNLNMSVFVYDYDHNAPNAKHLQCTHEKMFRLIRSKNPDLPIVLLSRPKFTLTDEEEFRLGVIKTTYRNAVESGDTDVYLIEGRMLMKWAEEDGTVDTCHPNDLGFASMAKEAGDLLEKILK